MSSEGASSTFARFVGLLFYLSGGVLVSYAGARYAIGSYRADEARQAWDDAEARVAVLQARRAAEKTGFPEHLADGSPVAHLVIPKIGLDEIVLEGVDGDDLNAGPGHLPGSALPGDAGNAIISAHRDRHFNRLGEIQVGDTLRTESGPFHTKWMVISTRVVTRNTPALFRTHDAQLTLTTCWPISYIGPAPDRLIITAKPIPSGSRRVASR